MVSAFVHGSGGQWFEKIFPSRFFCSPEAFSGCFFVFNSRKAIAEVFVGLLLFFYSKISNCIRAVFFLRFFPTL